jgi:hypothetical protein
MFRIASRATAGALVLAAIACGESTGPSAASADLMANALTKLSPGVADLSTSFSESATAAAWVPGPGGPGRGALGMSGLLGGGLGADFDGSRDFAYFGGQGGPGRGHRGGPFGGVASCAAGTFAAATGVITCPSETRNGLTIARTLAYKTVAGAAQQAYDTATTASITETRSVSGTTTFTPDSGRGRGPGRGHGPGGAGFFGLGRGADSSRVTITSATSTVSHNSTRTVTGLQTGATQRTVNAAVAGRESTTGASSAGAFTSTRVTGDTTRGLVIPVATSTNARPYPTAGTVIRQVTATVTLGSQAAQTTSRREVITYDGSATARITITQDGTTKNCTIALPRGRPTCA